MTNKKQNLKEDLTQIGYLMGYDRSKTIFEQQNKKTTLQENKNSKKQQINEVAWFPAIAAVLGASQVVDWVSDWWNDEGEMGGGEKYALAMDRNTYPEIEKALRKLEIETGVPVMEDLGIISKSDADDIADYLYEAMDGLGTNDRYMRSFVNKLDSVVDLARVTYEFGKKEGYTLEEWIDGDLSNADINSYIKGPLRSKPFMVYKDKIYNSGQAFLLAVQEDIEGEQTPEAEKEFTEAFACVVETAKKHGGKLKKSKSGIDYYQIRIGEDVGLFTMDGRVVFYPGGKKANRKPKTGFASYVCSGDELALGDTGEELSLDEGLQRILKKKSNLSEESINFGGMYFEVEGEETTEEKPEEKKTEKKTEKKSGDKQKYTKGPKFEEVVSGSRILHRGHMGPGVKKLQELLPGSNIKLDGFFGPKTEAAVIAFQKSNDTGQESGGEVASLTAKALLRGGAAGSEETKTPQACTGGKVKNQEGECVCPNGKKDDGKGKCIEDAEFPESQTVEVKAVNVTDNKGDKIEVGDQLVFDSEDGVDVIKAPNGATYETTDDVQITKYNKSGNLKKIVTDTQKIIFYKDGTVKKVKDRKNFWGKSKNK